MAIKLIGNELASRGQERFRRETQLLARLEHPAIARLIDAGVEAGRAWIALEFVAGRPIDAYCDERQLPLRARVRLLADLAGAVAAAHRMLVVHRDIKPVSGAIAYALQARQAAEAREMTARRGEFLQTLLKSADPRGGNRDVTVAQLLDGSAREIESLTLREPLVGASMLGLVAETNLGLGRLPEGLAASSREIELLRTHDGGSANLSAALSVRGQLLIKSGRYREAEAPLLEAVSLVEHLRGAEKQLGEALDDLGAAYQDSEREAQAELMYKRALDVYRKGGKALGVAASDPVANLGVLRYNEGRYAESDAYMREAVEIRGKYLPRDHPEMLDAEYNYATSLERNHQAGAAEPIFRELLASYQRTLGPDHEDTLMARQGVAHDLLTQNRYDEAAAEALPAAEGMSRTVGDDHDWTQTAWGVYGVAACLDSQREAGLAALRRVAMLRRNSTIANNWRTSISDVQLGICLVALGKDAEAEPLLLNAVKALEGFRGTGYDHTQAGYRALRDLYTHTGRPSEAALWQKKVLPGNQ